MVLPSAHPLLNQKFAICAFYSVAPSSIRCTKNFTVLDLERSV
ncbi:acetyltransferase [Vibrio cholerae]|nr:acetyltransferase [Vibrio cholerae]